MQSFLGLLLVVAFTRAVNIQWTGRGGTNLWDNPSNWDCSCLPTMNDNVFIAFSLGSVSVRIGTPAKAGSLTLGGSQTTFLQTLTVSGSLTIGGGTLNTNGALVIETGPTSPFNVTGGSFYAYGNGFAFNSGLIGGNGTFVLASGAQLNFSGPAAKEIAGNLKIDGKAQITSSTGASLFIREKGSVIVSGSLSTTSNLDILVDKTASFTVNSNGSFVFNAVKLLLQGPVAMGNWNVQNGQVTVVNSLTSGTLTLGASAQLVLIGGPDEQRTLGTINGGTVIQQGGNSAWTGVNVAGYTLTGGVAAALGTSTIQQLTVNGGSLTKGTITASTTIIDFGVFSGGSTIQTKVLEMRGLVTLSDSGTKITVTSNGQAKITAASQITFMEGTSFVIESGVQVSHNSPLKLVRGSPQGAAPSLSHSGTWGASSDFSSLGVSVSGKGAFKILAPSATFDFTNADFSADSLNSQGTFRMNQGDFSINTVSGTGTFIGAPKSLTSGTFAASNLTLSDGAATLTKANVAKGAMSNGILIFGTGQFGTFNLEGGTFTGIAGKSSSATIGALVVSGVPVKTISNVVVTASSISMSCVNGQCTLFTSSATIQTGK